MEPLAALVAVAAVCVGIGIYAGVLDASLPGQSDERVATRALDRAERAVAPDGVAAPSKLQAGRDAAPPGYHANVTLRTDQKRWATGPVPNASADLATTRIGVRVAPATVRAGRLRVVVWP